MPAISAENSGDPESLGNPDNPDSSGNSSSAVLIGAGTNEAILKPKFTKCSVATLYNSEGSDSSGIAERMQFQKGDC